jgi:hypothetical protein
LPQIGKSASEQIGVIAEVPQPCVAGTTKEAPDGISLMIVINEEPGVVLEALRPPLTDRTDTTLSVKH